MQFSEGDFAFSVITDNKKFMMVTTLETSHRNAIASKLADMKALQRLLITNEQKLIVDCSEDGGIEQCIDNMLNDDRDSLKVIEEIIPQFGELPPPKEITQKQMQTVEKIMARHELDLYEKILQHEGLKHRIVMTGLLIHKMAQVLGEDIQKAVASLNKINFRNRAHQEQLKSVILILGTRELIGEDPKQDLWAQAEDAIAALKGMFDTFAD